MTNRKENAFRGAFFYVIKRQLSCFLEDVSRRATGNSRHKGRPLFLSPLLLRQTIPLTFGHYAIALTSYLINVSKRS